MCACLGLGTRISGAACCRLTLSRIAHGTRLRRLQEIEAPPHEVIGGNASRGGLDRSHARNVPEIAGQFTRHAHHRDIGMFATCGEAAETTAQAQLRIPGTVDDRLGHPLVSQLNDATDLGREAIGPSRLDQHLACVAVAGLGDATELAAATGTVFGGVTPSQAMS